ncbi:MAG: hypothetical protein V1672_05185 [Candidatus Diapherotrites archaeon]
MLKHKRVPLTDKQIHNHIENQINKSVDLSTKHWVQSKKPVSSTGQSLRNLYELARSRGFFGHGNWYEYLVGHHKVSPRSQRYMPDERIHSYIKMQIDKGVDLSTTHWVQSRKPVSPTGQSLYALYILACSRKVGSDSFFGHGKWKAYIKWLKEDYEK